MWKPAQPQDAMLRGKWWEAFGDPELNGLEEQLNINNQNIKQYFENFMAARSLIREARSQFYPTVTVGPYYSRSRASANLRGATAQTGSTGTTTGTTGTSTTVVTNVGQQTTLLSAPLDISWEPDLWGRIRNTVRENQYAAQVSAADLENERLTEQAALAQAFFELRGEDQLQKVINENVEAERLSLDVAQAQYDTGIGDQISVVEAKTALASAEASAINVGIARSQYEHAIATLIGKPASDFGLPVRPMTVAPPALPIGVPSQLLERRPDIAAAERTMASANALIGVETAAYYPNLTLSAAGGFEASSLKHWFDWPSRFWSVGPTVSETVFDGGLRRATIQQYTATYNADVASYRQTVLTAFQQVEDSLASVRILSQQIAKEQQAVQSAQTYVDLAIERYKTGVDPYLNVLTAQTTLLADQQTLTGLQIQQMTSAVQLVEALGGGWDRSQLQTPQQVSAKPAAADTLKTP
jgi:NodT family efflux transporter outer membrane factor (OMF) lipoprotein